MKFTTVLLIILLILGFAYLYFRNTEINESPPVATRLAKVSSDGESAEVSSAFVVRVLDQNGVVVPGVPVRFSVSPIDGVLSATTVSTDSNGQARTSLTFGGTVGTYHITASVSELSSVTFTATATAIPPPIPQVRSIEKVLQDRYKGTHEVLSPKKSIKWLRDNGYKVIEENDGHRLNRKIEKDGSNVSINMEFNETFKFGSHVEGYELNDLSGSNTAIMFYISDKFYIAIPND